MNTIPKNKGGDLIDMLLNAASQSAADLRKRISNVRDAPLDIAIEKNCECIHFDFDPCLPPRKPGHFRAGDSGAAFAI